MSTTLAADSDIVLVLDASGVIQDVTLGQSDHPFNDSTAWTGMDWADTVTTESRGALEDMLAEVRELGVSRRRQVSHLSSEGGQIPVAYTLVRMDGVPDQFAAIGRDLRVLTALQQRLTEVQQLLEREHWRMRHVESRCRLLFQESSEALLLIDARTQKVLDANPAASRLFDQPVKRLLGRAFPFSIDGSSEPTVAEQLAVARSRGGVDDFRIQLVEPGPELNVSLSVIRQEASLHFLLRLRPVFRGSDSEPASHAAGPALTLVESLPDGFVVADGDGRVVAANRAFLEMIELATLGQARGQALSRWIGRPGADFQCLLAMLREHGVVRLFGTGLRGELGTSCDVEISSVALAGPGVQAAFVVRDISRRLPSPSRGAHDLGVAVEQLTSLVGRVSLKELVRDLTDRVERHFIKAALENTADNRTSAAEVLGVSRQSLYVKLRRYGLGTGVEGSLERASATDTSVISTTR